MGEILFLCHRIPFPPDRGDKIRSHHLLKAVARGASVHVATFAETEADRAAEEELAEHAASYCLIDRTTPVPVAGLQALMSGRPVSLAAFDHPDLRRWVTRTCRERPIDTIVVFSGQMGQYVPGGFAGRVVIDLCDVDSAKFADYAQDARWPKSALFRREDRLLCREEERLARLADTTLLISRDEAAVFSERTGGVGHVRALGNGIDTRLFDPATVDPHPTLANEEGIQFVFTGQMDYPPNVAAVVRFAKEILPAIRERAPARFHIVGRAPVREVLDLQDADSVNVWGEVPDIRPFLRGADVVVAPLTIARGVQNKVLEAMAMETAVLLSPEAAKGIAAEDGIHFKVCRDNPAFVAAALDAASSMSRRKAMGKAARIFVRDTMSWHAFYTEISGLVGRIPGEAQNAA